MHLLPRVVFVTFLRRKCDKQVWSSLVLLNGSELMSFWIFSWIILSVSVSLPPFLPFVFSHSLCSTERTIPALSNVWNVCQTCVFVHLSVCLCLSVSLSLSLLNPCFLRSRTASWTASFYLALQGWQTTAWRWRRRTRAARVSPGSAPSGWRSATRTTTRPSSTSPTTRRASRRPVLLANESCRSVPPCKSLSSQGRVALCVCRCAPGRAPKRVRNRIPFQYFPLHVSSGVWWKLREKNFLEMAVITVLVYSERVTLSFLSGWTFSVTNHCLARKFTLHSWKKSRNGFNEGK